MKVIVPAAGAMMKILGKPRKGDEYRLMNFCIYTNCEDGILLHNTLTREMVLLTKDEFDNMFNMPEMYEHWFLVPTNLNDRKLAEQARFIYKTMLKKDRCISTYTIFPTTDCNARCFYCFELGRSRIPMSDETAVKTAEFIARNRGNKKVTLVWFGGEPLYNTAAIDIICGELEKKDIPFESKMVSNGYLFDDEYVKRAKLAWHLKKTQITIDGTEDVYNRAKAYIYKDGRSAFRVVTDNIERLLNNGISVNIRMNISRDNTEDLKELIEYLHTRFGQRDNLHVYSCIIFGLTKNEGEEMERMVKCKQEIDMLAEKYNLKKTYPLSKDVRICQCGADSGELLTVTPDGNIGVCEHFSETDFVGTLDDKEIDFNSMKKFADYEPPIKECDRCFYYPECFRLKKCEDLPVCSASLRESYARDTRKKMLCSYQRHTECES